MKAEDRARRRNRNPAGKGTLRPHGGYRKLRSFQVTEIIYDGTVAFCEQLKLMGWQWLEGDTDVHY